MASPRELSVSDSVILGSLEAAATLERIEKRLGCESLKFYTRKITLLSPLAIPILEAALSIMEGPLAPGTPAKVSLLG